MPNELMQRLINKEEKIAVIGLGYVGLPVAVAFSKCFSVIGYDWDVRKAEAYRCGCEYELTEEVGDTNLRDTGIRVTSDEKELRNANVYIITVPTPVTDKNEPDLSLLEDACRTVGNYMQPGAVVIFESTVYPGVTEEICIPLLEKSSAMKCTSDFHVAYSPERINPGDKEHRFVNTNKIVSATDEDTLQFLAKLYGKIIVADIYQVQDIKVAEAAKLIENSQRDINIAFMNEISIMFQKMGIDTRKVLEAASTKWNFLDFRPGLVGGHCVGMASHYLAFAARKAGYNSRLIMDGRKRNDDMARYSADHIVRLMRSVGKRVQGTRVVFFGVAFKANCTDIRNSKVLDVVAMLREQGIEPILYDPVVDPEQVRKLCDMELADEIRNGSVDAVVMAAAHSCFQNLVPEDLNKLYMDERRLLIDLTGALSRTTFEAQGYHFWSL